MADKISGRCSGRVLRSMSQATNATRASWAKAMSTRAAATAMTRLVAAAGLSDMGAMPSGIADAR
jgi:hypothetical protein